MSKPLHTKGLVFSLLIVGVTVSVGGFLKWRGASREPLARSAAPTLPAPAADTQAAPSPRPARSPANVAGLPSQASSPPDRRQAPSKPELPALPALPEPLDPELLRDGQRFMTGQESYLALPGVQAIERERASEADLSRSFDEKFGVVFVRRGAHPGDLPKAAYNPRTRSLGVITGVYRIRWKSTANAEQSAEEVRGSFGFERVRDFPHLRFSLLRSRAGERLFEDLAALRKRPDIESAELEVLENPATPL